MLVNIANKLSQFIDPEIVHQLGMKVIKAQKTQRHFSHPVKGHFIKWDNKIGLAAGFDKEGAYLNELSDLGFGALEVGTITPKAQIGNPRPRIKKLAKEESILNWMGFPSNGLDVAYENLKKYNRSTPLGINIGKNKDTPLTKAIDDYVIVAKKLKEFGHYFVINISSPNTQGLRTLQDDQFLKELIQEYQKMGLSNIFVKLAPDLKHESLYKIVDLIEQMNCGGIIATNTTIDHSYGKGGLSGKRLTQKSYEFLKAICDYKPDRRFDLVGCGGISSKADIQKLSELEIDFFQIYSAFVYQGADIIKKLQ